MNPFIVGHRGSPFEAPENTASSVKKAIDAGVFGVEIDVHKSKDGEIVVIHDNSVDRTTNGNGLVSDFTLEELKKLKTAIVKDGKKLITAEKIPLLQEIIDTVRGKIKLVVEIKEKNIEKDVVKIIEKNGIEGNSCIISFYHDVVKNVKSINRKIETGVLFVGRPVNASQLAKNAKADMLAANYQYVDKELVDEAHKNKVKVFVWNIDNTKDLKKMLNIGVYGIGTNYPRTIISFIGKLNSY